MSYNGSGTFQINTSGQPVVAGTVISSTAFNALTADLATGLSTAITKDGQTTATARIPFAAGISSTLTTDSSSVSTGSIITAGGVGIAKALYVGTTANIAGTTNLAGLTASSAVATDASKNLVSVTNTGTGNNVLATSPTLVTPNLGTPASGILTNCTGINYDGFKNRIINGAMVIDQRNAGAAVTTSGAYVVDRWFFNNASDGTLSVQQSTDVPSGSGFKYSLKMTATVGDATIGAAQYCNLQHRVEGYNFADTGFGASGASSVTLSFWVKATVAGNYSVALYNSAENRIYPQQFSVLVSNTWEQKTLTIAGDTSGTWLTTNGIGVNVTFFPALGSNFLGSTGWNAGGTFGVTGQSNAIASNANIFAITGVQLEKGSTATSFDYRPYGTELALCLRYFETNFPPGVAVGSISLPGFVSTNSSTNSSGEASGVQFSVKKRAVPTIVIYHITTGTAGQVYRVSDAASVGATPIHIGQSGIGFLQLASSSANGYYWNYTASAEL